MRGFTALLPVLLLCSCAVPRPDPGERFEPRGLLADHPTGSIAAHSGPAPAAAPAQQRGRGPQNWFDIMFGASYWDGLGDLDPTGVTPVPGLFGDFDDWGGTFDFGYDRAVWSDSKNAFTVGVETGWSTFGNDGRGISSSYADISASMWYLTPVVRWRRELSRNVTISPGIGAGYYGLSFDEYETYYYGWWWGYDSRTLYDDGEFGGFLSLLFDFHLDEGYAIRVENKLHYADFDGLGALMPNENGVDGPIFTIEIGFVFAF